MTITPAETFIHKFGGWHEAEARRWTNPNGSVGGIVAVTATVHADTFIPQSCEVWGHASIGSGARLGNRVIIEADASIGSGAHIGGGVIIGEGVHIGAGVSLGSGVIIGSGDWFISGGPCGSRDAMWTAVYSAEHGLRWWVGCKHGITTEQLARLVDEAHRGTDHYDDYMAAIAFVTGHPGLKRAMASNQGTEQ